MRYGLSGTVRSDEMGLVSVGSGEIWCDTVRLGAVSYGQHLAEGAVL